MATNKTIYFNDEMEEAFNLLTKSTGMKAGQLVRHALLSLMAQKGLNIKGQKDSYFATMPVDEDLKSELAKLSERLEKIERAEDRRDLLS